MALQGTLGDFSLADILQLIGLQRKTGLLVLYRADEQVSLGFHNGLVVSAEATSRPAEHRIGQFLVRAGKLTEDRLQEALRLQKETLQRLGHILVGKGWVDRETFRRQMELQISETVFDLFRWKDGTYDFQPGSAPDWDQEFVDAVPAEHLIMEGARLVDEWPLIEHTIPSRDTLLCPTQAGARLLGSAAECAEGRGSVYEQDIDFGFIPSDPLQESEGQPRQPRLTEQEIGVLRWVDSRRKAGEIADLTGLGTFDTFKILAHLVELGFVARVVAPTAESAVSRLPGLFKTSWTAKVVQSLVGVLVALGVLSALQDIVGVLRPDSPALPLPRTLTAPERLAAAGDLEDFKRAVSACRLDRLERGLQVHYLDTSGWPGSLGELAAGGYVSPALLTDPWGRPYQFELHPWGYRLGEVDLGPGMMPQAREHRFTVLERSARGVIGQGNPSQP